MSLCDNILPHEKTPFAYFLTTYLFDKLDGHIVQSSQTENELQEVVENPVYEKRFHPIYTNFPKKIEEYAELNYKTKRNVRIIPICRKTLKKRIRKYYHLRRNRGDKVKSRS